MPNRSGASVGWVGLEEFCRDLRNYGRTVPRLLGQVNHDAAQLVAEKARQTAEAQGSTAAHVAPSIRAGFSAREATVSIGSNAFPMALGAEFGAKRYKQFKPWTGNQYEKGEGPEGGYFLGPSIRGALPEFLNLYGRLFDELHDAVFHD